MTDAERLAAIFHAYDIRGVVPSELDERLAYAIGVGFARFVAEVGCEASGSARVLVARDARRSGEALAGAFAAGVCSAGGEVIDLGLASTDLCYFASGRLDRAGAMLTASHNPAMYNGVKLCLPGAKPVGEESGLRRVRELAEAAVASVPAHIVAPVGLERVDLLEAFAEHVRSF